MLWRSEKQPVAIATAVTLPCSHNSVIPDASHWFDKTILIKTIC